MPAARRLRLALDRGEIEGFCGVGYNSMRAAGLTDGRATILVQIGQLKNPHMPGVPFIMDYAKSDEDRQIFKLVFGWLDLERPIAAPPGVPQERVNALRTAFDSAMKDPALAGRCRESASRHPADDRPGDRRLRRRRLPHAARGRRQGRAISRADGAVAMRMMRKALITVDRRVALRPHAHAQTVEQFYKGRTVNLIVGFNPGGAYDPYARTVARHLPNHLPGAPNIVVKNMQGAGSVLAANHLYNVSPKDGSELGLIAGSAALEPVFAARPTNLTAASSPGSAAPMMSPAVCFALRDSGFTTAQDLFDKQLLIGASGTSNLDFPLALNAVAGTRMRLVRGYNGTSSIMLAMERGEVQGICGMVYAAMQTSHPDWIADSKVRTLVQIGLERNAKLADVPFIMDFVKRRRRPARAAAAGRLDHHGPALSGAARHSGRPQGGAAPSLQRDDEGPRVPGRRRQGAARYFIRFRASRSTSFWPTPTQRRNRWLSAQERYWRKARANELAACKKHAEEFRCSASLMKSRTRAGT